MSEDPIFEGRLDTDEDGSSQRVVETGLIRRADIVRIVLVFFLLALTIAAPENIIENRSAAHGAILISSLIALWTQFGINRKAFWEAGRLPLFGTLLMIADIAWLSLFIYGTGGHTSPFWILLLLPILFAGLFLSSQALAFLMTTLLVALVNAGFALEAAGSLGMGWQLGGRLLGIFVVAWLIWGLAKVLERERHANESIIRILAEGIILIDKDGDVILSNPQIERFAGTDNALIVDRNIEELRAEPRFERFNELIDDVGQEAVGGEFPITRDLVTGLPDPEAIRIVTIFLGRSAQPALGWVVVCQDLTDITGEREITGGHLDVSFDELRSPLATLRAVSQVISTLTADLGPDERSRFVFAIKRQTRDLLQLVSDMMDVSALEKDALELQIEQLDVCDIVEHVADVYRVRARLLNIAFQSECEADLPEISGDRMRLQQALGNLCDNAVQETPEEGSIEVRGFRRDGQVAISVSDTGGGIPPERLSTIFKKFTRADEMVETSAHECRLGIGLYVARSIARLHGGDIQVESTPGEGSTFTIVLPVEEGD